MLLSGPNELEFLAVSLCTSNTNRKHCVALLYRPPSCPVSFFDNFCSALHFLNPSQFSSFVLLGDFNIDFCSTHPYFCKLQSVTQPFSLSQVVTTPTHLNSNGNHTIIDLVFVSHEQQISDCSVIAPLANSDHCGLRVTLSWKMPQRMTPMRPRTVWRYKDANFAKARDMINAINWSSVLPMDNPDTAAMVWQNKFLDIMDECIPAQRLPRRRKLPWLTKNVVRYMRKRNAAFKKAKKNNFRNMSKYKNLRNKVTSLLRQEKASHFEKLKPSNMKQFWKAVKSLTKKDSSVPTLHLEGATASLNTEKASMLNKFFASCFNPSLDPLHEDDRENDIQSSTCPPDYYCTEEEVLALIQSLDVSKASGPDGISIRMLKGTAASIAPSLTMLFNTSLRNSRFPNCWKQSSIVPIPKGSAHDSPTNYRPISLLSVVSKLLEKHIHLLLTSHLNHTQPISTQQWGFQQGKSTVTSLLTVVDDWLKILESKRDVCAVFFDLTKAFDTVPHRPLMAKLEETGLNPHLLEWIRSYLTDRQQKVVVGGEASTETPVLSGVPQGSVLGPLLFLVYIDDITAMHLSSGSILNLYADDMLLYKAISTQSDYQSLQDDVDRVQEWVNVNYLTLNTSKCKSMVVSRRRNQHVTQLQLGNDVLKQVDTFKYLGVLLSSDLTWTPHIESICSKARKLVGLLYRQFSNNANRDVLLRLYTSIVRPHLEYAAEVWDPHLHKNIELIENVQKQALKMCTKQWDLGYQALLEQTHLQDMGNRRMHLKLCTLFKIVHGLLYFPNDLVVNHHSRYSPHTLPLLHCPYARTTALQKSFLPSSISVWNHLPPEALHANSIHRFKLFTAPLFL